MKVSSFEVNEARQLVPISTECVEASLEEEEARVWIDLQAFEPEELEDWLGRLGVEDLPRQLCLEARDRPGFYPLASEILMVFPVLGDDDFASETDHVAFLCREDLLLTMHQRPVLEREMVEDLARSQSWLSSRSVAGLVSAIVMDLSLSCLRRTADLRAAIISLEDRMDRDPDEVEAEEILRMRSDLVTLGALVSDQLTAVQAMSATARPFFQIEDAREYVSCALVNLQSADRSLDWLDNRLGTLRSGLEMHA